MKNGSQGNRKQMGGNRQSNQSNQKSQRKGQGMRSEAEVGEEDKDRERRE